jgi:hypothetical protein
MREIILKNPLFLNAITFFKNKNFNEEIFIKYLKNLLNLEKIENREVLFSDYYLLKYNFTSEIDYITLEIYLTFKDENKEISDKEMIIKFKSLGINIRNI